MFSANFIKKIVGTESSIRMISKEPTYMRIYDASSDHNFLRGRLWEDTLMETIGLEGTAEYPDFLAMAKVILDRQKKATQSFKSVRPSPS
jgi:hypothetical protein